MYCRVFLSHSLISYPYGALFITSHCALRRKDSFCVVAQGALHMVAARPWLVPSGPIPTLASWIGIESHLWGGGGASFLVVGVDKVTSLLIEAASALGFNFGVRAQK